MTQTVLSEDTLLTYSPAATPDQDQTALPDDFSWADSSAKPSRGQGTLEFDTIEFETLDEPAEAYEGSETASEGREAGRGGESEPARGQGASKKQKKPRRFSGSKEDDVSSWLGVADDFSARKEGGKIGSWDNFDDDGPPTMTSATRADGPARTRSRTTSSPRTKPPASDDA